MPESEVLGLNLGHVPVFQRPLYTLGSDSLRRPPMPERDLPHPILWQVSCGSHLLLPEGEVFGREHD